MSFLGRLFAGWFKKKITIIIVGLDNSGKTTLLQKLKQKPNEAPTSPITTTIPTVGFSVDGFSKDNIQFTAFDMSGQEKYRNLWEHYYSDANAVVFVIDSSDQIRAVVAKEELQSMLDHKEMQTRSIPILVFANKKDVDGAMNASECSDILGLDTIKDKPWHICACSALNGEGIEDGFNWLADQLK